MAKVAKIFLGLLIFAVLLVLGGVVAITQWVNPNDFKPQIQAQAAKQGIPLQIAGDLSWQFFPSFGISIGQSTVYESPTTTTNNKILASIEEALAKVAVSPLLKKQLVVETLFLDGFNANLVINKDGKGNWEPLINASSKEKDTTKTKPSEAPTDQVSNQVLPLGLVIHQIHIRDGHLDFSDASQQQSIELSNIQLMLSDVNIDDAWFPLTLAINAHIQQAEKEFAVHSELSAQLKVNDRFDQFSIGSGQLVSQIASTPSAINTGNTETIDLTFSADVRKLEAIKWQAKVDLKPFNAKNLLSALAIPVPKTTKPSALERVGLSLQTKGTPKDLSVAPMILLLDETQMDIDVQAKDFDTISLKLSGNSINLDDYLPPPSDKESSNTGAEQASSTPSKPRSSQPRSSSTSKDTPEPEDPFAALREFTANIDMHWDHLIANKLHFENITLKAKNKSGVANISKLSTDFYDGNINLHGQLDARKPNSQLQLTGDVAKVEINPMLSDLIDNPSFKKYALAGSAFGSLKVESQGKTVTELVEGLDATVEANTQSLQLAPVNIQRYVCQAVALLNNKKLPDFSWPKSTQLQDVKAVLHLRDQVATLEQFNAGVENFLLGSFGELDLRAQEFDFRFPFTLLELKQQPQGCPKPNTRLINQTLSLLKCQGSIDSPTCKLDAVAIRDKAKSLIAARAKEELKPHQEKLEKKFDNEKGKLESKLDKEKEKLEDKLKKRFGDDVGDKLKGIFKR